MSPNGICGEEAIISNTQVILGMVLTRTGVSSSDCSSVGASASFISTTSAPPSPRSSAVTGLPAQPATLACSGIACRTHVCASNNSF